MVTDGRLAPCIFIEVQIVKDNMIFLWVLCFIVFLLCCLIFGEGAIVGHTEGQLLTLLGDQTVLGIEPGPSPIPEQALNPLNSLFGP